MDDSEEEVARRSVIQCSYYRDKKSVPEFESDSDLCR